MINKRQKIAIVFLIMFFILMNISSYIGIAHLKHNCIDEECNICYGINLLKTIFEVLKIVFFVVIIVKEFEINRREKSIIINKLTPILLRVELTE